VHQLEQENVSEFIESTYTVSEEIINCSSGQLGEVKIETTGHSIVITSTHCRWKERTSTSNGNKYLVCEQA